MKMTPLIQKAIISAAILHKDQKRKVQHDPYISHPYSVAVILSEYTDDQEVLAAALLHDVLEDVKNYYVDDMRRDFGERVTALVQEVSEDKDPNKTYDEKADWRRRKDGYLVGLEQHSLNAVLISAADKLHNLSLLNDDIKTLGKVVLENFNSGAHDQIWFYEQVTLIVRRRLGGGLADLLDAQIILFKELVG